MSHEVAHQGQALELRLAGPRDACIEACAHDECVLLSEAVELGQQRLNHQERRVHVEGEAGLRLSAHFQNMQTLS
jgi:hypothetical protein